jgi:hypothetical protein
MPGRLDRYEAILNRSSVNLRDRGETYRPDPVRRAMIPKPDGGERPLGIPTIRDRVAQTAAKLVLEPIFEADFEDSAYGYRPARGRWTRSSWTGLPVKRHGALTQQGCLCIPAGDLTSARLSSVLADLEEDQRMASWAYCRNRSASVMTVSCLGDALFPSALPDVLGTLNTQKRSIGRPSWKARRN